MKYHTEPGTGSKEEKAHNPKHVPPPILFTTFKLIGLCLECQSNLAGTDLLRFTEFWRRFKDIELANIRDGTRKSNADHGTNYLNLSIDGWIVEAAIE